MKVVVLMVWGTRLTKRGKRELLKSCPYLHLSATCTSNYTVNTYLHQECSLTVEHLCTCVISKVQSPTLRKKKNSECRIYNFKVYIFWHKKYKLKRVTCVPWLYNPSIYILILISGCIFQKNLSLTNIICFALLCFLLGHSFQHTKMVISTPDLKNLHSNSSIISLLS